MKTTKIPAFTIMVAMLLLVSFSRPNQPAVNHPKGNLSSVVIGKQVWMTKNLAVLIFRNGDSIPIATTDEAWRKAGEAGKPACCYYKNDGSFGSQFGLLYNWYAVQDPRGLAPTGWRVPGDTDWIQLADGLGGLKVAGNKMKSENGWSRYINETGNGMNTSRFSGLPGGYRLSDGTFYIIDKFGYWWSATDLGTDYAWNRSLSYNSGSMQRNYNNKSLGFSVRCLKE